MNQSFFYHCRRIDHNEEYSLTFEESSAVKYAEHVMVTVNYKMVTSGDKTNYEGCTIPADHSQISDPCSHQKDWPNRGDVTITLKSPSGTKSVLMQKRKCDICQDGISDWSFMSVQFWGENPLGKWDLIIQYDGSSGYLELTGNQTLHVYGVNEIPESVKKIPAHCDSACVRGCAASGSKYCDSCKKYRDPVSLECIDTCDKTIYNGYCLDYNPKKI